MRLFTTYFLVAFVSCCLVANALAQSASLIYPAITKRVAQNTVLASLCKGRSAEAAKFQMALAFHVDSLYRVRLIGRPYHASALKKILTQPLGDTTLSSAYLFIDALVATAFDLFRGSAAGGAVGYDAVSPLYRLRDDSLIEAGLRKISSERQMSRWLFSLEPSAKDYLLVRKTLLARQKKDTRSGSESSLSDTVLNLQRSLQLYRWIFHFGLDHFMLVNIASAQLNLYEKGSTAISMRAIVGKPSTPTPRFASFCKQLILYPYWYVPASIAIGEYLSKIKRDPGWLDQRNMQLVDAGGRVVDHYRVNWKDFHAGYFPYTIRQSTGCDNALGVLKFDIETPYGVYLHDTNNKSAFLRDARFLSHGCIRLEEPLLLGSKLLRDGLDTAYLQSCFADKKPIARALEDPVAVFCLYLPATFDAEGRLRIHRDVYKLFVK